jgi:hypothetical protein
MSEPRFTIHDATMSDILFDTPEALEAAFYRAFSSFDLDLMKEVWADDDKVLCIHPGSSLLRGKSAVVTSWMEIFSGREPPAIEYRFVAGFAADNLVVHLVEERIRPRDGATSDANRVLATNVFLQQGRSWRLVEHHASLPLVERDRPFNDDRQLH